MDWMDVEVRWEQIDTSGCNGVTSGHDVLCTLVETKEGIEISCSWCVLNVVGTKNEKDGEVEVREEKGVCAFMLRPFQLLFSRTKSGRHLIKGSDCNCNDVLCVYEK